MIKNKRILKMETKIIVFTQTNNAAVTLQRCINSILRQSYKNIVYYIVDNNSTDGTVEIIQHYAKVDPRIIPYYSNENKHWQLYNHLPGILEKYKENDCLIVLDADDEYLINCIEELLDFKLKSNLDIAGCASDFVDGITGAHLNQSHLFENLIVEGTDYSNKFPVYFKFMRDSWGKLYSLSLFKQLTNINFDNTISNGSISVLVFQCLLHSKRLGVLAKRLHKYYIYPNSTARCLIQTRIKMVTPMLYQCYKDFLIKKCGYISHSNEEFLYSSYYRALINKLPVIINSPINLNEKIRLFYIIFSSSITFDMLNSIKAKRDGLEDKANYVITVIKWINSQDFSFDVKASKMADYVLDCLEDYK